MLVLTRKRDELIVLTIGDEKIIIHPLSSRPHRITLDLPFHVKVDRKKIERISG
jgi:sRNA-binding carbon storage regulator CsrA